MPAGTFPVPKDVRTGRSFTIVKGIDKMIRTPVVLAAPAVDVVVGEWMSIDGSGEAAHATSAATLTDPLMGARAAWTLYDQDSSSLGQSDAMATGQVDLLSAPYQAKTKVYDTGATWTAGALVVVIHNGGTPGYGFLAPLDPATVAAKALTGVVGQVVVVPTSGVLHYEAK